jgi:shikimate kinase
MHLMARRTLILIGLRGSGKSSLGRCLAHHLAGDLVDLDDRTPGEVGCSDVASAWKKVGEAGFRAAEVTALRRVLEEAPAVLALGGGTPTAPGAAELLRGTRDDRETLIIYLHAAPAELRARLAGDANAHRPALLAGGGGVLGEIEDVYQARDPLYRTLADHVIETAGRPLEELVREVASLAGP